MRGVSDANSAISSIARGARFGVSVQSKNIHGAAIADTDLRMAVRMDTLRPWQLALSGTGNRWWYMPIDAQWQKVTITGKYPKARFYCFAVYDNAPVSTALADHLYDAQIVPDPGSVNPFETPDSSGSSTDRCPFRKRYPEINLDCTGSNSLFLRSNSLFLRKNSLFR